MTFAGAECGIERAGMVQDTGKVKGEAPLIVGIGGATRADSSTERLLRHTLSLCEAKGARTLMIGSDGLDLPLYAPEKPERSAAAVALVEALRRADGIILGTPGYHAAPSGLIKNALDYAEDLRTDAQPYFDGRAVGCLVTSGGWQAGAAALITLRQIIHALRGWPTPLGVVVNTSEPVFDGASDAPLSPEVRERLETMAAQVMGFAAVRHAIP